MSAGHANAADCCRHDCYGLRVSDESPRRIQLSRAKGWRKPENTIVVARPSKWGNPYTLDMYRGDWQDMPERELRRMAVSDFRGMLDGRWEFDGDVDYPSMDEIRAELTGKNLACWCPLDQACHASVLLELACRDTP